MPVQVGVAGQRDRPPLSSSSHQGASWSALQAHRSSRMAVIGKPRPDTPLSGSGQRGGCTRRGLVTDAITRCARSLDPGCIVHVHAKYTMFWRFLQDVAPEFSLPVLSGDWLLFRIETGCRIGREASGPSLPGCRPRSRRPPECEVRVSVGRILVQVGWSAGWNLAVETSKTCLHAAPRTRTSCMAHRGSHSDNALLSPCSPLISSLLCNPAPYPSPRHAR
jgi:hypothetical protein